MASYPFIVDTFLSTLSNQDGSLFIVHVQYPSNAMYCFFLNKLLKTQKLFKLKTWHKRILQDVLETATRPCTYYMSCILKFSDDVFLHFIFILKMPLALP